MAQHHLTPPSPMTTSQDFSHHCGGGMALLRMMYLTPPHTPPSPPRISHTTAGAVRSVGPSPFLETGARLLWRYTLNPQHETLNPKP